MIGCIIILSLSFFTGIVYNDVPLGYEYSKNEQVVKVYFDPEGGAIMSVSLRNYAIIGLGLLFLIFFFLSVNSYFGHKEILAASNGCYESNGMPVVSKDRFALNWSFSCDYSQK